MSNPTFNDALRGLIEHINILEDKDATPYWKIAKYRNALELIEQSQDLEECKRFATDALEEERQISKEHP